MSLFYDPQISRPLTFGAWFCRKFCDLYASIYGSHLYNRISYQGKKSLLTIPFTCRSITECGTEVEWINSSSQLTSWTKKFFMLARCPSINNAFNHYSFHPIDFKSTAQIIVKLHRQSTREVTLSNLHGKRSLAAKVSKYRQFNDMMMKTQQWTCMLVAAVLAEL